MVRWVAGVAIVGLAVVGESPSKPRITEEVGALRRSIVLGRGKDE
jgi:hypothetical protein